MAEDVAWPLLDRCGVAGREGRPNEDWIWLCLLELWRRWWPERVCVEFLADKIQAGYDALERREETSGAAIWLDAWSDVVRICELTGIDSIRAFDDRCPMYQSLFNWSGDLEDALWNAGREDPEFLRARIGVRGGAAPSADRLVTGAACHRRACAGYWPISTVSACSPPARTSRQRQSSVCLRSFATTCFWSAG